MKLLGSLRALVVAAVCLGWVAPALAGPVGGGDWTPGWYDASINRHYLRNTNNNGPPDLNFVYSVGPGANFVLFYGDWDGDGDFTPGYYSPSNNRWLLRNTNNNGAPDLNFVYAVAPPGSGMVPLVGDWNGDGTFTPGYYNPTNNRWLLRNSNNNGAPDLNYAYAVAPPGSGLTAIVGDWDGTGGTSPGYYNPANNRFLLRNANSNGAPDFNFPYSVGPAANFNVLVGDWDGNGSVTPGFAGKLVNRWFLRNTNSNGAPDLNYVYSVGPAGTLKPVVGDWDAQ